MCYKTLFEALCSLKCMGGDGIPPAILKGAATALLDPIHHLFQLCVSQSSIPTQWRDHYITPIPKSGDKSVISNYRPISLLSSISKLFEKVVSDKIFDFLIEASVSNCQYGFIRNRSTIKQLLLHSKNIINALEDHQQLDTVLLDIRKAFSTVPHHILLTKLWQAGITGSLWRLVRSYLSNRRQCVSVAGHHSSWLPVTSGVPQGSILGPLLFLIHINDLPSFVYFSSTLLYADDTKLSKPVSSLSDCSQLQHDIWALQNWSAESGLSFNSAKSFLLRFCPNSSPLVKFDYLLNDVPISSVSNCRDLGIVFSSDLSWSNHYKHISKKAYGQLFLLIRTFTTTCPSVKRLLYISLVRSQITYCSPVWRPMFIKDIVTLETIQRRSTKYTLSYRDRLISLNLLPLMYFYEYLDIIFFVQCLQCPDDSFNIRDHITFSSCYLLAPVLLQKSSSSPPQTDPDIFISTG